MICLLNVWWTFSFLIQHNMTWICGYICVYIMFKGSYIWILVSQSFEFCCKTLKSNKLSTLWESFRAKSLSWPGQMYPVLSVVPSLPCTLFLKTHCFPCFDLSCSCQNYMGETQNIWPWAKMLHQLCSSTFIANFIVLLLMKI